ncbi:MAG: PEP-utilizing enzyme [candidate division KSB1 bacterium]|nr:PEP-utilizing enzyme [candidate division KSB1 bacterium]
MNEQLEQADLEKLCDILESTHRLSDHFLSIHRWSITFADLFAELLYHFLQKTLQRGNLVQDLLSGLPGNASVQAETALDALDVENKYEVQKFINCYGHRSQSLDFSLPTWSESIYAIKKLRTDAPLKLLKEKNKEIYLRHNKLLKSLQKLLEIKYGVAAFLFKAIYKMVYNAAAQFVSCRENQRDLWQKILYISRRSALKIGRILQSKGVLDSPQEIFFLHYSEIRAAVKGDALDFPVQKRKNEFEIWVGNTINTQVKEADLECRAPDHNVLFGIGVSAGTVTGKARVIKTFEEALSADTNEIIVAPAVDPGWTPVFAQISGLVLEYGGLLSHAAIIAREFHLPAVTGIPEVTRIIKTGDLIAIDGQHGIVKLLKKPS